MLTKLRIKNFKSWNDTGEIKLAPLTVLFGNNSSGKSSLGQFLLMLKQTAQSPDRQRVLHFGNKKDAVDLGTYPEIVHRHSGTSDIEFELAWRLPTKMTVKDGLTGSTYSGSEVAFSALVGTDADQPHRPICRKLQYVLGDPTGHGMAAGLAPYESSPGKYEITEQNYRFTRKVMRAWRLPGPTRFYGFPDEVFAYYQNVDVVRDLTVTLEKELSRIFYLGPLREYPERQYTWSGEVPENVGFRGKEAIPAILAAAKRTISRGGKTRYQPFAEVVASWLKNLGIIHEFDVTPIAPGRMEYEVKVRTTSSSELVKLPDVGFGVSQVLPVIVQCFYPAEVGSTVLMEQPEIHLHPSVQAKLADLFIQAVQCKEEGKDKNTQLIIESHSEHFLRRLQRLIAEGAIAQNMVAVYFCEMRGTSSVLTPLNMDESGNILNWPDNFFGDQMDDIAALGEATANRRIAARSNGNA